MDKILLFFLGLAVILLLIEIKFRPRFDFTEKKELLLWYSIKGKFDGEIIRDYIKVLSWD